MSQELEPKVDTSAPGGKLDPFSTQVVSPTLDASAKQEDKTSRARQVNPRAVQIFLVIVALCVGSYLLFVALRSPDRHEPLEPKHEHSTPRDTERARQNARDEIDRAEAKRAKEELEAKENEEASAPEPSSGGDVVAGETPPLGLAARLASGGSLDQEGDVLQDTSAEPGKKADTENPWLRARQAHQEAKAQRFYQDRRAALDSPLFFPGLQPVDPDKHTIDSSQVSHRAGTGTDARRDAFLARIDAIERGQTHAPESSSARSGAYGVARESSARNEQHAASVLPDSTLPAGTMLEVVWQTGLSSEHEGLVIAQVSKPVWNASMTRILIPAGTRVVGSFRGQIKPGQTRAPVSFERLIFSDRRVFDIQGIGTGLGGQSGVEGTVDEHVDKILAASVLAGGLAASGSALQGPTSALNTDPRQQAIQGAGQTAQNSVDALIKRYLDVPPTLTIQPGHRAGVLLVSDLSIASVSSTRVPLGRYR